jgi:hypothetical protein
MTMQEPHKHVLRRAASFVMAALLVACLCALSQAAVFNSAVWAPQGFPFSTGTGPLAGLTGPNTVTYTTDAVLNAGQTFDTAAFTSWNASPGTNAGGALSYSSTLAGVLATGSGFSGAQSITFSTTIINPVLMVDFAASTTKIDLTGVGTGLTLLSSNNCALAATIITCPGAGRAASDGFAVQVNGTFGAGTSLTFNYSDTAVPPVGNSIGFSIASITPPYVCPQAKSDSGGISGTPNSSYEANVPTQGTCNFVITATGSPGTVFSIVAANTAAFDGATDVVIGVVNTTSATLTGLSLASPAASPGIFVLTGPPGDGICAYRPFLFNGQSCNVPGSGFTFPFNYLGSAVQYSNVGPGGNSGTVNFMPGIPFGGTGYFSLENLTSSAQALLQPPIFTKRFLVNPVQTGSFVPLKFDIVNPSSVPLTGVSFSDMLSPGLNKVGAITAVGCGAFVDGSTSTFINVSGATVAAIGTCSMTVVLSAGSPGVFLNTSSTVTSNEAAPGGPDMDTLTVVAPPTITQDVFGVPPPFFFQPYGFCPCKGTLIFTLTNPGANTVSLDDIEFKDNLPGGLVISTPNGLSSTCGPTSPKAVAGTSLISLAAPGANLAPGASCTISVRVTLFLSERVTNTTSNVTAFGGTIVGTMATADIGPLPFVFLYPFFSN